jgi:hypothetical protein
MRRTLLIVGVVAVAAVAAGSVYGPWTTRDQTTPELQSKEPGFGSGGTGESQTSPRTITLKHDFGVVRPSQSVSHEFRVTNPSDSAWTFAQFRITCGCTVADISSEVIPPGGSATVTFSYRPPSEVGDDRRSIDVVFQEPSAPLVRLTVEAKAREPVSLFPVRAQLPRAMHGRPHETRVFVGNYTAADVSPPKLVGSHPWLSIGEPRTEPIPTDDPTVRQYWSVPVVVDTGRLTSGRHEGSVTLAPGQPHATGQRTVIEVEVVPPLEPNPSQLFFGTVRPGRPSSVTFSVRPCTGLTLEGVRVEHDLGSQLEITPVESGPGTATWKATLTVSAAGPVGGTVTVRAAAADVPATRLPVLARVVPDDPQ